LLIVLSTAYQKERTFTYSKLTAFYHALESISLHPEIFGCTIFLTFRRLAGHETHTGLDMRS